MLHPSGAFARSPGRRRAPADINPVGTEVAWHQGPGKSFGRNEISGNNLMANVSRLV